MNLIYLKVGERERETDRQKERKANNGTVLETDVDTNKNMKIDGNELRTLISLSFGCPVNEHYASVAQHLAEIKVPPPLSLYLSSSLPLAHL